MAPPPLAQSAERRQLWARLGCESESDHRMMLNEASDGRDRLSCNPNNLTDLSKADPSVRPPYKWDQLTETAKHREILNIYARASPRARRFYDRAHYKTLVGQNEYVEENWAIRWFIWHSFRYRDNRDHRAAKVAPAVTGGGGVGQVNGGRQYWDAARAEYRDYRY